MMLPPSWLLPQPPFLLTAEMITEFDRLFDEICQNQTEGLVDYYLDYPKWQFLSYLGSRKAIVLHGSYLPTLTRIEPRQARDIREISAQDAIYATTDGIWAIFFAILDRKRFPIGLNNTCLQASGGPDNWSEPMYFFSITRSALEQKPWCQGAVYILPQAGFELEPPQDWGGTKIVFPHWIGKLPVRPLGRLLVEAADFPFLAEIHGHNDAILLDLATHHPEDFPWLDAMA